VSRKTITEQELAEFSRCSLRLVGGVPVRSPYLVCAEALWKWAALRSFQGKLLDLSDFRTQLDKITRSYGDPGNSPVWVRIAHRIYLLFSKWQVRQPDAPYHTSYGMLVTGNCSVVSRPGRPELFAVVLTYGPISDKALELDTVSMLRSQHLAPLRTCSVLQFRIDKDEHRIQVYNPDEVRKQMTALTDSVNRAGFARPGDHCLTCVGRACERVLWTK
jgi:hypothetical protein